MDGGKLEEAIDACFEVKKRAYCPYSNFPVGAAAVGKDGKIYTGCNMESAVYPLTVCAERNALSKAISEGCRSFKAMVISSNIKNSFITPCGACRQVMAEFGRDIEVYMTKPDRTYKKMLLSELLPLGFGPENLKEEHIMESEETNGVEQ